MLLSYTDLRGFSIRAADEETGSVDDIYFDDHSWQVRYLVAHTGFLLTGRENLVGTARLGTPDASRMEVPVDLTAEELKAQDPPEAHAPVSRQRDRTADYGALLWPPFLVGSGVAYTPGLAEEQLAAARAAQDDAGAAEEERGDPNLRAMSEVTGYAVAARDGEIGSIIDFLIDAEDWCLRHLVVDTGNWLPGRRVAVTTGWIENVDWENRQIRVSVDVRAVEEAPRLDSFEDLIRSPSKLAAERYGELGYWPI